MNRSFATTRTNRKRFDTIFPEYFMADHEKLTIFFSYPCGILFGLLLLEYEIHTYMRGIHVVSAPEYSVYCIRCVSPLPQKESTYVQQLAEYFWSFFSEGRVIAVCVCVLLFPCKYIWTYGISSSIRHE